MKKFFATMAFALCLFLASCAGGQKVEDADTVDTAAVVEEVVDTVAVDTVAVDTVAVCE